VTFKAQTNPNENTNQNPDHQLGSRLDLSVKLADFGFGRPSLREEVKKEITAGLEKQGIPRGVVPDPDPDPDPNPNSNPTKVKKVRTRPIRNYPIFGPETADSQLTSSHAGIYPRVQLE